MNSEQFASGDLKTTCGRLNETYTGHGEGNRTINSGVVGETSIDTFVQLVSLHFSGLIAIVRSQEPRVPTQESRKSDEPTETGPIL